MAQKPTVLIIAEGYGLRSEEEGNAIELAKKPNISRLLESYPHSKLKTFGPSTGLEKNQAISTSAAYQQIGTGRIPKQQLRIINKAIKNGEFFRNQQLLEVIKYVKSNNSSLHLIGMLSDGGIHSHIEHLFSLLELAQHHFLNKVYMHIILDGIDVEPTSARKYLRQLDKYLEKNNTGSVATVIGRNLAMTSKSEKYKKAFEMFTKGKGTLIRDPMEAVNSAYRKKLSDAFVEPTVINQGGLIKNKDAVILYNFRTGNSETLIKSFTDPKFKKINGKKPEIKFLTLMGYESEIPNSAFKIQTQDNSLSEFLSQKKIRQLKIVESTTAEQATIFFNGNQEQSFEKEEVKVFNSPKDPQKNPSMCATKISKHAIEQIRKNKYGFIMVSFPNMNSVAKTGNLKQATKSVQAVDKAIGEIVKVVERKKGVCIITSTHGNAEQMQDKFGRAISSNTTNPVPFIITKNVRKLKNGKLSDVAPTILKLMRYKQPKQMKGKSLY